MLFSDSFFTVAKTAEAIIKEKGSKFLAFVYPVSSEQEIKDRINTLKKLHPSATHHCFAWRLGADKLAHRFNDDGEPSGTAGKPIFSQILSNDLTNVLIVVVRYFGGTMLGVPGLIQSYKSSAAEGIKLSGIEEQFIIFEYELKFPVEDTSAVMKLLKDCEAKVISTSYNNGSELVTQVKKKASEKLESGLKEIYRAEIKFIKIR